MGAFEARSILLAYDGSPSSKSAIAAAGRLFKSRPALVVSVWESTESLAPAATIGVPAGVVGEASRRLDEEREGRAVELAAEGVELASEASLSAEPRPVRSVGNVWATLCHLARDLEVEAVVLGSRGRSAVESALLGSVSSGVVQHSPVPTLVVRTPGDSAQQG